MTDQIDHEKTEDALLPTALSPRSSSASSDAALDAELDIEPDVKLNAAPTAKLLAEHSVMPDEAKREAESKSGGAANNKANHKTEQPQLTEQHELRTAREEELRRQLRSMRRLATGLFVGMTAVFAATLLAERAAASSGVSLEWLGYVKAFAEAAMVGALADWFAVTALFRRPLGLPIPHTAIIKTNKDRIGASLGNFVESNFLTTEVIAARIGAIDLPQKAAEWISNPEHAHDLAERVTKFIPDVLNAVGNETVQTLLEENLTARLRSIEIAPLAGTLLSALTAENRHQGLFDEALKLAGKLLEQNKDAIRQKIREESPWYVPSFIDDKIYERIITRADETLRAMNTDPNHELRRQFHRATQEFIHNLRTSPDYQAKAEALKQEFLNHPVVRQYFSALWSDVRRYLLDDVQRPDSTIKRQLEQSIRRFGESLLKDEQLRVRMNTWLQTLVQNIIAARKNEIATLIAQTVQRWDGDTMSERIELYVGKDLQYIRINGTIVGGLVGLCIYVLSKLLAL
jgi:uncharacterized membrane-anchored protein YjiN (DUF445 family)